MTIFTRLLIGFTVLIMPVQTLAGVIDRNLPTISYVSFQSPNLEVPGEDLTLSGQLRIPVVDKRDSEDSAEPAKLAAVIILHGSAGVDSRGSFYADALNSIGIATLEIDMWAARGISGGTDRPALPTLTVPDAFSALHYLAEQPNIDPERIAVIGFSWGGVISMLAATESYTQLYGNGLSFAAYVAHYPVCWAYNIGIPGVEFHTLTDKPLLIQVGSRDDYDEGGDPCKNLVASLTQAEQELVTVNVIRHAYHGWDRLQPAITVEDPFSHLGAGGEVRIVPNPGKAFKSRKTVVRFFRTYLQQED